MAEIIHLYSQWNGEENKFLLAATHMVPLSWFCRSPGLMTSYHMPKSKEWWNWHAAQTDWNKLNRVSLAIKCHSSDPISWHLPTYCRHLDLSCPFVSFWSKCKYYTWKHLQVQSFLEAGEGPGQLVTSYSLVFMVIFVILSMCLDKLYAFYFKTIL